MFLSLPQQISGVNLMINTDRSRQCNLLLHSRRNLVSPSSFYELRNDLKCSNGSAELVLYTTRNLAL